MEVVLLERIEKLGTIGDIVNVKNGFARNFLLPRKKALRATAENVKQIEAERATYEAKYNEQVKEAQGQLKSIEKLTVTIIRQASEDGKLYGSLTAKEIANEVSEESKLKIAGNMVNLKGRLREVGLHDVEVVLHPEVKTLITVNVARTEEEAKAALLVPKDVVEKDAKEAAEKEEAAAE